MTARNSTLTKQTAEKFERVKCLNKIIEDAERELEKIFGTELHVPLPSNFSINDAILDILQESENGASARDILAKLQSKYPSIERVKINGALMYLFLKKKKIERVGRGFYRMKMPNQEMQR